MDVAAESPGGFRAGGQREGGEGFAGREGRPAPVLGPGRYQGEFQLWGRGRYLVSALGRGDGRNERATSGFAVPYSPEYLRFRSSPIVLSEIAGKTGGRILTGDEKGEEIFPQEREAKETSRSVVDLFLLFLACMIPLDVGVRRIQPDWMLIRGWFGLGKAADSGATIGALLRRKQEIRFGLDEDGTRGLRRGVRVAAKPGKAGAKARARAEARGRGVAG